MSCPRDQILLKELVIPIPPHLIVVWIKSITSSRKGDMHCESISEMMVSSTHSLGSLPT